MNKEDIDMLLKYKIEQTIRGKSGFEIREKLDYPLTDEAKKARKRAYNLKQRSDPRKEHDRRLKDAERKREKRANLSLEENEQEKKKDRERKAHSRILPVSDKEQRNREKNKIDVAAFREKSSHVEKEFERLQNCLIMRKLREKRGEDEYLLENLLSKEGMRSFRQLGKLREYQQRNPRELDDETLWYRFWIKGIEYRKVLRNKIPDICKRFEEQAEQKLNQIEKERQEREEERRKGFWDYNPNDDCYHWTGDEPPPCSFNEYNGLGEYAPPDMRKVIMERTPEEWEEISKHDEFQLECYRNWYNEMAQEEREERIRIQRERRAMLKEQLSSPIEIPEFELSEYEKLREKRMKEIEEFMKSSGLFD